MTHSEKPAHESNHRVHRDHLISSTPFESFFSCSKRERIRQKTCATRKAARRDVFECIEMFYNPKRINLLGILGLVNG